MIDLEASNAKVGDGNQWRPEGITLRQRDKYRLRRVDMNVEESY